MDSLSGQQRPFCECSGTLQGSLCVSWRSGHDLLVSSVYLWITGLQWFQSSLLPYVPEWWGSLRTCGCSLGSITILIPHFRQPDCNVNSSLYTKKVQYPLGMHHKQVVGVGLDHSVLELALKWGDSRVCHWCSFHILTSSVIYYWNRRTATWNLFV